MSGRLVILSGPSGVGKDTVIDAWKAVNPRVERVIAYTTREPRQGEIPGIDYHFVTVATFNKMAQAGKFLECKEVHGNYYATPLSDMVSMLAEGKIAILKIDVQGALVAMGLRPEAISVFILPPSMEELEHRIRDRAQDSPQAIEKRLANARDEMAMADHYQIKLVNDVIERVVSELENMVANIATSESGEERRL